MQVDQGHEFIEDVLDEIERFLAAKVAALRHDDQADPDTVDVPTGGLALDFAKHTDPEVRAAQPRHLLAWKGLVASAGRQDMKGGRHCRIGVCRRVSTTTCTTLFPRL